MDCLLDEIIDNFYLTQTFNLNINNIVNFYSIIIISDISLSKTYL